MSTPDRDNIRFNVLRNALYHTARRGNLDTWNRVFNFAVVLLGTAAFGDIFNRFDLPSWPIGAGVAIIGTLQLVFDFGDRASLHQTLQRSYFDLLADIEAKPDATEQDCAVWQSRMIRITADEPPLLRAVDAKAYNDAIDATEFYDKNERLYVPLWHRWFAGLMAFDGRRYDKFSEIDDKKQRRD